MNYELVYILTSKLSDEDAEKKSKEISELVKKEASEIVLEDFWGKKDLAYPIDKLEHGYYVLIQFKAENDVVKKIDKKLKLTEEIIRFLIVKKDVLAPMKEAKLSDSRRPEKKEGKKSEPKKDVEKPAVEEKIEKVDSKSDVVEAMEKKDKEEVEKKEKKKKADMGDLDKKLDDILGDDID